MYFVKRKFKINVILKNNPKGGMEGYVYCVHTHNAFTNFWRYDRILQAVLRVMF